MALVRALVGSSVVALMASAGLAQVSNVGNNRSEVRDNGQGNQADVDNGAEGNERNGSLIIFNGNDNRAAVEQVGADNGSDVDIGGNENDSDIRQFGFGNGGDLIQTGNLNSSAIDQYIDPSIGIYGRRVANVQQVGNQNSSSVTQVHWNNTANVTQGNANDASEGGVSTIYQFSAGNTATVTMTGGSADAPNRSHVEQTRIDPIVTNSEATVSLTGSANLSSLQQIGARNSASHDVSGTANSAVTRSYGNDLTAWVAQRGEENSSTIDQYAGDRNSAIVEQGAWPPGVEGRNRQASIIQSGSGHSGGISQLGSNNSAMLSQSGNATTGSISQTANDDVARLTLYGESSEAPIQASIVQGLPVINVGGRSTADMSVRGSGNTAQISQVGFDHRASVDITAGSPGSNPWDQFRNIFVLNQDGRRPGSALNPTGSAGHSALVQIGGGPGTIANNTMIQQLGEHATTGNSATVRQWGPGIRVDLSQTIRSLDGEGGSIADISVSGEGGRISVAQAGRHRVFFTQGFGASNTFEAVSVDSLGSEPAEPIGSIKGNNNIDAAQYGDRNQMIVWQTGSDSNVTLWQKVGSSDNRISINQGRLSYVDSPGSNCQAGCQFAYSAAASVTQSSQFNAAEVAQYGTGGRATIEQAGTGTSETPNEAVIRQERSDSEALILQTVGVGPSQSGDPASGASGDPRYFAGGARNSIARIYQADGALEARIEQRGRGQQAFIDQRGANIASILQDVGATNATAIITQSGSGNNYSVNQTAPGQYINVTQTGTNNSITNVITRP